MCLSILPATLTESDRRRAEREEDVGTYDEYGRRAEWADRPGAHRNLQEERRLQAEAPLLPAPTEPCSLCGRLARGGYEGCCGVSLTSMAPLFAPRLSGTSFEDVASLSCQHAHHNGRFCLDCRRPLPALQSAEAVSLTSMAPLFAELERQVEPTYRVRHWRGGEHVTYAAGLTGPHAEALARVLTNTGTGAWAEVEILRPVPELAAAVRACRCEAEAECLAFHGDTECSECGWEPGHCLDCHEDGYAHTETCAAAEADGVRWQQDSAGWWHHG